VWDKNDPSTRPRNIKTTSHIKSDENEKSCCNRDVIAIASFDQLHSENTLGVRQIWVHRDYRGRRIATQLVDCARMNFSNGSVIFRNDVAFSQPTDMGKIFAFQYVNHDHILIYTEGLQITDTSSLEISGHEKRTSNNSNCIHE
jgi:hypothetical protein